MTARHGEPLKGRALVGAALGAVGVVYGDIGTSPLYAIKECFAFDPLHPAASHGVPVTEANVLGVLSLVFWSLTMVIVVKYLGFILRADNEGEGGILSMLALFLRTREPDGKPGKSLRGASLVLFSLGLVGASLLFGEGTITPAISVLSAMEGLEVITPNDPGLLKPFVVPATLVILVALFAVQRHGTKTIGRLFGPATILWFLAIAAAGLPWILRGPHVLAALNPLYGVQFFVEHKLHGFFVLGSVVLCITGGEALYADMGHFGKAPIRLAWFALVYPALLLNYFGQGAFLLAKGQSAAASPFFGLVEGWLRYPLVAIATIATIVASQALISGSFSLASQAVQLGYSPRVTIVHTADDAEGQIYVPEINWLLMVSCIALVLGFGSSTRLAAAYGIAVTGAMTITSILFFAVMSKRWGTARTLPLLVLFLSFDLSFFLANVVKIAAGGWFPLALGAVVFSVMTTWKRGRAALYEFIRQQVVDMDEFLAEIAHRKVHRVEGTAVFMTQSPKGAPWVLTHHVRHNKVLHENVILLSIQFEHEPKVPGDKRVVVTKLGEGVHHVQAHYGFMQSPRVKEILLRAKKAGVPCDDATETTFYLGRETLLTEGDSAMSKWRKVLFAFLSRNARPATTFFQIPPDRVVEIGMQVQL
jgi:KUP system potassium uptake protein